MTLKYRVSVERLSNETRRTGKAKKRIKAEKAKREADKKPKRQSTIKSKRSRKSKTTATQLELKLDD